MVLKKAIHYWQCSRVNTSDSTPGQQPLCWPLKHNIHSYTLSLSFIPLNISMWNFDFSHALQNSSMVNALLHLKCRMIYSCVKLGQLNSSLCSIVNQFSEIWVAVIWYGQSKVIKYGYWSILVYSPPPPIPTLRWGVDFVMYLSIWSILTQFATKSDCARLQSSIAKNLTYLFNEQKA